MIPLFYTYAKIKGMRTFKAIDINQGIFVKNLVYATLLENIPEIQEKLQNLSNQNQHLDLKIQLRSDIISIYSAWKPGNIDIISPSFTL